MSSFTRPMEFERFRPLGFYRNTRVFRFYLGELDNSEYVEIHIGFVTNFMTSPRWTRLFYRHDHDTVRAASTVHDGLVGEWSTPLPIIDPEGRERFATWWEAANIYRQALKVRGTSRFWRWFFYANVVAYGVFKKSHREIKRLIKKVKRYVVPI